MSVSIMREKCRGCRFCIRACPFDAIKMIEGKAKINYDKCTDCGACVEVCPVNAIKFQREKQ